MTLSQAMTYARPVSCCLFARWFAAYALGSNDSVSHINNVYFGSNKVTSANISIVVSVGNTILYLDAVMIFCRCVR